MRNLYLFEKALQVNSIVALENGFNDLNNVILNRDKKIDNFICNPSIWVCKLKQGKMYDLYNGIVNSELQRIIPHILKSFNSHDKIYENHIQIDIDFPNDCNGFTGFEFSHTNIPVERQVIDVSTFELFKEYCLKCKAFSSLENFWNEKSTLFPNLVFCNNVLSQINHFSVDDDRFKLMTEKLKRLNDFVGNWKEGSFNYKNCGLDCAPDTPTRVKKTEDLRTFNCPNIGYKIFILHIRWYFGSEPFRLYFYPEANSHKVYIGYIGAKKEIGF
jgi:hypothetical protein